MDDDDDACDGMGLHRSQRVVCVLGRAGTRTFPPRARGASIPSNKSTIPQHQTAPPEAQTARWSGFYFRSIPQQQQQQQQVGTYYDGTAVPEVYYSWYCIIGRSETADSKLLLTPSQQQQYVARWLLVLRNAAE